MRTVAIVIVGLALLALSIAVGRNVAQDRRNGTLLAIRLFGIAWFVVSAMNMGKAMRAGSSVETELVVFALVFGLPAAAAYWATRRA